MIHVTPRARISRDRAGDPLDGLVNMFDIGIVLAVAFLLAALSSLGLEGAVSDKGLIKPALGEVKTTARRGGQGRPAQRHQDRRPRHARRHGLPPRRRSPRLRHAGRHGWLDPDNARPLGHDPDRPDTQHPDAERPDDPDALAVVSLRRP